MSNLEEIRESLEGTIEEAQELARSINESPPDPDELAGILQNTLTLLSDLATTVADLLDEIE
jgi:hypothetical protein